MMGNIITPQISVIIPVYNAEEYLCECLDSVVNQTLKDIEIICIDDGSTDTSLAILQDYAQKDARIKVLTQKNEGAGAARNVGVEKSSGEYIAFLDGDDFYNLEFLSKMYAKAFKVDSDITICGAISYNVSANAIEGMSYALNVNWLPNKDVFSSKDINRYIFNFAQNWNWNKLFKRIFIVKNNIKFQKLYRTNDLLFTCTALALANRITTCQENLVNYRTGIETNSQSTNHLYPFDFYEAFIVLREFLLKEGLYNEFEQSYINHALLSLTYNTESIRVSKVREQLCERVYGEGLGAIGLADIKKEQIYNKGLFNKFIIYKYKYQKKSSTCFWQVIIAKIENYINEIYTVVRFFGMKIMFRNKVKEKEKNNA